MARASVNSRVLCLQGSLGTPSRTATLVELTRRVLEQQGAHCDVIDLRQVRLPQVDPRYHGRSLHHPDRVVADFVRRVRAADAIVWASPVYHNSYSAALKNALDHLAIEDVTGKPLALCGNGGRRASPQPTDHLRTVARSLHQIAIPIVVTTANDDYVSRDGTYLLDGTGLVHRVVTMCEQLLDYTARFATDHQPDEALVSTRREN